VNTTHDLVGAYAVDALTPAERAQFEDHLTGCADCTAELAGYREALAQLADSHAVAPPPEVAAAVLDGLAASRSRAAGPRREASRVEPGAPPAVAQLGTARRRGAPSWLWLAAAAAAIALFAGGVVVGRQTMPATPVAAGAGMVAALEVAAAGDASFVDVELMGAQSRVVTSGEMDKSVFLAAGLPTPAKGMCYQVWRVNPDGSKESAGVFVPDADGHVAVVLEGGAEESTLVITVEPPGGSKAPTGEMVGQVST
jgi:anti-sigma-K factor RskA